MLHPRSAASQEIVRRLELDRLDLAILRTDLLPSSEYEWVDLVHDEVCIVCSTRHRLAHRKSVTPTCSAMNGSCCSKSSRR